MKFNLIMLVPFIGHNKATEYCMQSKNMLVVTLICAWNAMLYFLIMVSPLIARFYFED